MWKQLVLGLGLTFAASTVALADPPAPPAAAAQTADSHLAAAIDLLDAQNAKANMTTMVHLLMSGVESSVRQSHPGASDEKLKLFNEAFEEEITNSTDDLLKLQAKIYAEHFSEDELRQLAAFYRSDLGKKYISELPVIMKETVPLGVQWGQMIAPRAINRAMARLKKEGVSL
jgi:uncharacterized protein